MSLVDYAAAFPKYHTQPYTANANITHSATGSLHGPLQVDPSYYIKSDNFISIKPAEDVVNEPKHYSRGKYQVWDIIEHFRLNYNIGNVCKYILRGGKKTECPIQDYKKAIAYLQREVDILEGRLDVRPK